MNKELSAKTKRTRPLNPWFVKHSKHGYDVAIGRPMGYIADDIVTVAIGLFKVSAMTSYRGVKNLSNKTLKVATKPLIYIKNKRDSKAAKAPSAYEMQPPVYSEKNAPEKEVTLTDN